MKSKFKNIFTDIILKWLQRKVYCNYLNDQKISFPKFFLKVIIKEFVSIKISNIWSLSFASWKYPHHDHESISNDWFMYNILSFFILKVKDINWISSTIMSSIKSMMIWN